MVACRQQNADEPSAYERVLADAIQGDVTLFARQDYAEEAWRIVDPVLKADTPVHEMSGIPGGRAKSTSSSRLWEAGTTRLRLTNPKRSRAHED